MLFRSSADWIGLWYCACSPAGINKEKYKESTDHICGEYKLVLLHHVVIRVQIGSFPSRLARKQQDPRIDWLVFTSS